MSERKDAKIGYDEEKMEDKGYKADSKDSNVVIDVKSIDISPNPAPLSDELSIEMSFVTSHDLLDAWWDISYLIDTVHNKRYIINIGSTSPRDYLSTNSICKMHFTCPNINTNGLSKSKLVNVGLLTCVLKTHKDDGIISVKMVTQVTLDNKKSLVRNIFNPLI